MRRVLGVTALAVGTGLAALVAPVAHADENAYVNYIQSHGWKFTGEEEGETVAKGQIECKAMRAGKSENQLTWDLEGDMSNALAALIVRGAHLYLCPDAPVAYSDQLPKR